MIEERLTIRPVKTRRDISDFIRLPRSIYLSGSPWVRPLDTLVRGHLDFQRNPFYATGSGTAWIALRGGRPVGRILAHSWPRHAALHGERVSYFGLFECADDPEASSALIDRAAERSRAEGFEVLRGPFNLTAAQEIGIVVSGFDNSPAIDMVYTAPWYPRLFESTGLRACFEMETWINDDVTALRSDAKIAERRGRLEHALGLRVRTIEGRSRDGAMEQVRDIVNDAFLGNWGFVPITREEWSFQVSPLLPFLDPALVLIAEVQGVPVATTFGIPDFNRVLRRTNGRLAHPASISMLRRPPSGAALIVLFATRKGYQESGICKILNAELLNSLRRRGYRSLAATWIGSGNHASRAQAQALLMRPLHRLAMYEMKL